MAESDIEDQAMKSVRHFIAGAFAGVAEHTGAFPIDTIKTHMQARKTTAMQSCRNILSSGGPLAFFRGWTAIAFGAAPAHAAYFTSYELVKRVMGSSPLTYAVGGTVATLFNDSIITPMDAVKQKRQLNLKGYRSTWHCLTSVIRTEGLASLYAGFTTTLTMNIPFHALYFNIYEILRKKLAKDNEQFSTTLHFQAGAGAGMTAAALTNPLDVAKTRLQTRSDIGMHYRGMVNTLSYIWIHEGMQGLTRGIFPRMIFHSFSAAILWSAYEYLKFTLGVVDTQDPIQSRHGH